MKTLKGSPTHPGEVAPFGQGTNEFALSLFGQLRQQPGNLFFSPFSIRTALAMTQSGARGETAGQMRAALRMPASDGPAHTGFAEIIRRLNAAGGGEYEMAVANSLWGQDGAPLKADFLEFVSAHYGGGVNLVDFRRGATTAQRAINRFVEEKTKHKIRNLIPPGGLGPDTRLVLVNAVYFKGKWVLQFDSLATHDQPFYLEGSAVVQAPLMQQFGEIGYMKAAGYQAVDLEYRGGELSMLVLLPDRKSGLPQLEESLSEPMIRDCVARLDSRQVNLFLPRFKCTWGTVNLAQPLAALGMTLPFNDAEADFSGINGREGSHAEALYLSAVFHKAFVETNEEGTEAAAATAVEMRSRAAGLFFQPKPIPTFLADHPFLFMIRDRQSSAILFIGRMADPSNEGGS